MGTLFRKATQKVTYKQREILFPISRKFINCVGMYTSILYEYIEKEVPWLPLLSVCPGDHSEEAYQENLLPGLKLRVPSVC
jgi:hypothetical protein